MREADENRNDEVRYEYDVIQSQQHECAGRRASETAEQIRSGGERKKIKHTINR
jgi:hypothetical protein